MLLARIERLISEIIFESPDIGDFFLVLESPDIGDFFLVLETSLVLLSLDLSIPLYSHDSTQCKGDEGGEGGGVGANEDDEESEEGDGIGLGSVFERGEDGKKDVEGDENCDLFVERIEVFDAGGDGKEDVGDERIGGLDENRECDGS